MSNYLVKLDKYIVEWSTIVDGPLTEPLTRKQMIEHLQVEYGREGTRDLEERLKRLDEKGTSSMFDKDARSAVAGNRAGPNESEISYEDLVAWAKQSRRRKRSAKKPAKRRAR